jgi:hypothetical protein
MRTLASVQRVGKIEPIPNADKIELAHVLGWQVVIRKGEFKEGDWCTYVEIDSVLPEKPEYEFLRERKFRIKTIKLRGQFSQGLLLPPPPIGEMGNKYHEGCDVTEMLGIKQYEPKDTGDDAVQTQAKISRWLKPFMRWAWFRRIYFFFNKGDQTDWPDFVSKTDETRIQSMAGILNSFAVVAPEGQPPIPFMYTEKLDGCSATYCMVGTRTWYGLVRPRFLAFSRNINVTKRKNCLYIRVAELINIKAKLLELYKKHGDCAVQGEIIGTKIQGNKYQLDKLEFRAFQIVTRRGRLHAALFLEACSKFDIQHVPVLQIDYHLGSSTVDDLVKLATRESTLYKGPAEGIVVRSMDMVTSFKVINPEFLVKYDA